MAVVSVEKQPDLQASLLAKLVYQIAQLFIEFQRSHNRYPSRFPLKMLQYSAEHGHVEAMSRLGRLLYKFGACRAEKCSGLEYVRRAAKHRDANAQFVLGEAYSENNMINQQNRELATHWLALAADNGHTQAASKLRDMTQQNIENQEVAEQMTLKNTPAQTAEVAEVLESA